VNPITEIIAAPPGAEIDYPTSDGRPMGETDLHRAIMFDSIESLKLRYAGQQVYVSGNILLFYEPGNRRRHVSPDVLVVKGIEHHDRENYLLWEEGLSPNAVIEVTSKSTRKEDLKDKFAIYRDKIRIPEYFLFDPRGEYLEPALQGYRLISGRYKQIKPIAGRLPSRELGLALEQHERQLRFFDPKTGIWIPTWQECRDTAEAERRQAEAERRQAEAERRQAEAERRQAEAERRQAEAERRQAELKWREAEAEAERLRREVESLRQQLGQ
jgi:Uma2 family endonuclease